MATSQEIIDRATSLLRVRTSGVTFSTDDANKNSDVFIAFKNMLNEFGEDGLVNIPEPSSLTDTLDIPAGSVRGLAYNLAVEVAAEFGLDSDSSIELKRTIEQRNVPFGGQSGLLINERGASGFGSAR